VPAGTPPHAGYSGTPLPKKLGIKPGMSVALIHGPKDAAAILGPLPDRARLRTSLGGNGPELLIAFFTTRRDLERGLARLLTALPGDGVLWVAWPKKTSGVATDLSDEVVRGVVLPTGWVDTKVCAIDASWSGLKFVLRTQLRP